MASKVTICNMALQNIGAKLITSLSEGSANADECNARFDEARRALLSMHLWNFATKRVMLNVDTETPAFNYAYQYTLPSDLVYLVQTRLEEGYQSSLASSRENPSIIDNNFYEDRIDKYRIEGNKLLTNSASVGIVYIADETNTELYSPTFTQLLARFLGSLIAYRIKGSSSERDTQYKLFTEELEYYQSIDSQQGIIDVVQRSALLAARL